MRKGLAVFGGTVSRALSKLRGSGGSALPGLVTETIDPKFLARTLGELPFGVGVISGTNGKTTTAKIVTELLEGLGLRVFTNKSGSNFTRGIVSEILPKLKHGKLPYDIAILELDEAHAVHFVDKVRPQYSLLLNVFRDQLDRFGEIDTTAKMLEKVCAHTAKTVVTNANEPLLRDLGNEFFGFSANLREYFPTDANFHESFYSDTAKIFDSADFNKCDVLVTLNDLLGSTATYNIGEANLQLTGAYNALNGAAALAFTKAILRDLVSDNEGLQNVSDEQLLKLLSEVKPAFGRGEKIQVNSGGVQAEVELILVKNPSGFRLALKQADSKQQQMIVINDDYADGRDVSWLWDVDFSALTEVAIVSGVRAYDMALRLQAGGTSFQKVEPNLANALSDFVKNGGGQIFTTYTAMLKIRKLLGEKDYA